MTEVGSLWVRLRGDTSAFESAMQGVQRTLGNAGQRMSALGAGLSKSVTLPLVAIGTAAVASATLVEGAMATIRGGTGATGVELEALGEDFRAVFRRVPENADQVSAAITDLNVRLGLTGEPLRQMTEQMLELANLTGAQIEPLIAETTRVFGDWGVATEHQAATLDLLWKTSQTTGIEVGRLAQGLVQFGAPLRMMGFSLEESAVLMGKWEQEGVNTELVLGSLRMAMGHFAKENIPMREGLDATMQRIQELGPSAEATALAMDIFGARAGPDMAAAILEGRFAIDELLASVTESPETIMAAGAETETFAEKLAILRNNASLALEPLGDRLLTVLTNLMPQILSLVGHITRLAERFAELSPQTQTIILVVAAAAAAFGPLLMVLGKVVVAIGALFSPIGLVIAGVVLLAAAWKGNWGGIQEKTQAVLAWLQNTINAVIGWLTAFWAENGDAILASVSAAWAGVQAAIGAALEWIGGIVETVLGAVQAFWSAHGDRIMAAAGAAWEWIVDKVSRYLGIIQTVIQAVTLAISGDWYGFGVKLREAADGAWALIRDIFSNYLTFILGLVGTAVQGIVGWFQSVDWGAVGRAVIEGIATGIRNAVAFLKDAAAAAARAALDAAKGFLGIESPSEVAAASIGAPFVEGIGKGIEQAMTLLRNTTLPDAMAHLTVDPMLAGAAYGTAGGATNHYNITVNIAGNADRQEVRLGILEGLRAAGVA